MAGRVGMLCRVTIGRTITTVRPATRLTGPQVQPMVANLHAFVTLVLLGRFNGRNCSDMRTTSIGHDVLKLHWGKPSRNVLNICLNILEFCGLTLNLITWRFNQKARTALLSVPVVIDQVMEA